MRGIALRITISAEQRRDWGEVDCAPTQCEHIEGTVSGFQDVRVVAVFGLVP